MLLINFSNRRLPIYKEAVRKYKEQTGSKDIYIDRNAYANGYKLSETSALRCNSHEGIDTFWDIFHKLEEKQAEGKIGGRTKNG